MSQTPAETAADIQSGKVRPELLHDVAKGGVPAAVLLALGWMLSNQLQDVAGEVKGLRDQVVQMQVEAASREGARWTSTQQTAHEREMEARLREIDGRLTRLEAENGKK